MMERLEQVHLACYQLVEQEFSQRGELVGWMGAVQGQDYVRSEWTLGLRLQGAILHSVDEVLRSGGIVFICNNF